MLRSVLKKSVALKLNARRCLLALGASPGVWAYGRSSDPTQLLLVFGCKTHMPDTIFEYVVSYPELRTSHPLLALDAGSKR